MDFDKFHQSTRNFRNELQLFNMKNLSKEKKLDKITDIFYNNFFVLIEKKDGLDGDYERAIFAASVKEMIELIIQKYKL